VNTLAVVGIVAVAALAVLIGLFRLMWRVAEPNEALIISGLKSRGTPDGVGESLGFRMVTGKGTFVIPGIQTVRRLSLDLREAALRIESVTQQGIPVGVVGVVIYKVGDDFASIANAARRFLGQQGDTMDGRVQQLFAGHLRAIVGSMTVEEMIRDREKLSRLTRESTGTDMEKLGLIIDSLQIQELDDRTGYIANLGAPQAAAVARDARIAQAAADREATEREQEAEALKAEARRASEIKQASYKAEIDQAAAKAQQAGPLAEASARQQVVVQETEVAKLEAEREEQRLQTSVRRPADAKAYEQTTLAQAQRDTRILEAEADSRRVKLTAEANAEQVRLQANADAERTKVMGLAEADATRARGQAEGEATRAKGEADGASIKAKGMAEADAIHARAEALAENQDAVIGQELASKWPEIVEAAAKPFGAIDQMIVLNGAEGLSQTLAQALGQGAAGLKLAREMLGSNAGAPPPTAENGAARTEEPAATP
jgi:flotillin